MSAIRSCVGLFLLCPLLVFAQPAWKVDPAHYTLEFENESVTIVRGKYGPHESSAGYFDVPNHVVVIRLTPAHVRVTYADGRSAELREDTGSVTLGRTGRIRVQNLSDQTYELVAVGVKGGGATPGIADLDVLKVDPGHHGLLFDNAHFRVIRAVWGAKEVARGAFEGGGALVLLTPAQFEVSVLADGSKLNPVAPAGAAMWMPPGVILPRNTAAMTAEFIVVQPKH